MDNHEQGDALAETMATRIVEAARDIEVALILRHALTEARSPDDAILAVAAPILENMEQIEAAYGTVGIEAALYVIGAKAVLWAEPDPQWTHRGLGWAPVPAEGEHAECAAQLRWTDAWLDACNRQDNDAITALFAQLVRAPDPMEYMQHLLDGCGRWLAKNATVLTAHLHSGAAAGERFGPFSVN